MASEYKISLGESGIATLLETAQGYEAKIVFQGSSSTVTFRDYHPSSKSVTKNIFDKFGWSDSIRVSIGNLPSDASRAVRNMLLISSHDHGENTIYRPNNVVDDSNHVELLLIGNLTMTFTSPVEGDVANVIDEIVKHPKDAVFVVVEY